MIPIERIYRMLDFDFNESDSCSDLHFCFSSNMIGRFFFLNDTIRKPHPYPAVYWMQATFQIKMNSVLKLVKLCPAELNRVALLCGL